MNGSRNSEISKGDTSTKSLISHSLASLKYTDKETESSNSNSKPQI